MRWLQKAGTASFVKFPLLIQFLLNSRDFGFVQICSIGGGHLSREALRNLPGAREGLTCWCAFSSQRQPVTCHNQSFSARVGDVYL